MTYSGNVVKFYEIKIKTVNSVFVTFHRYSKINIDLSVVQYDRTYHPLVSNITLGFASGNIAYLGVVYSVILPSTQVNIYIISPGEYL